MELGVCHRSGEMRAEVSSSLAALLTPLACVLEELDPGRRALGLQAQVLGKPRQLPREEAALGVWHHGQMPPVGRGQRRDPERGAVGVHGVLLGGGAITVDVADGCEVVLQHVGLDGLTREQGLTLTVRTPGGEEWEKCEVRAGSKEYAGWIKLYSGQRVNT